LKNVFAARSSGWLFWLILILVSVAFLVANESPNQPESSLSQTGSADGQIQDGATPAAAPAISEAPKLISENGEPTSSLAVPFSRLYKTAAVNDILVDPRGFVWAATEQGLSSIKEDQLQNFSITEGSFPFQQAECLAYDGKDLWIGTLTGLCVQNDSGRFVRSELSDSLPSQLIWSLTWDGNTIWAGTQNGAAFMKPGSGFQTINEANTNGGLRNNWCHSLARPGTWFVAAHDRGLSIWNINFPASNPELWKNIDHARSVISRPITDIAFDGTRIWLGTGRGVLLLTTPVEKFFNDFTPNLVSYSRIHGLPANRVNALIAHRNSIWAGTDGGLVRIREDRIQLITASSGSAPERVRKLAASGDILWIGSDRGLQFINTAMVD